MTLRSMRLKRNQAKERRTATKAAAADSSSSQATADSSAPVASAPAPTAPSAGAVSGAEMQRLLEQASYFLIFTVPDPESLSVGEPLIPFIPQSIYRITITEAPRRLAVRADTPTAKCGFRLAKAISKRQVATQNLAMEVCPNDYETGPGRTPPPTLLLPIISQRFWMLDGHFDFLDGLGTGFRAIAGGRFFPAGGLSVLIGGIAEITEGLGQLKGFKGNLAINGLTTPPALFANTFLFRFVDPTGALRAPVLPPVEPEEPDPDYSDSAVLPLTVAPHPDHHIRVEDMPSGPKKKFHIVEQLHIASSNYNVAPGILKTDIQVGALVGERRTTLVFDPNDPQDTIPLYSLDSIFTFYAEGQVIGTLEVDLAEGRLFRDTLPQNGKPFFRMVGFGPLGKGTGQFKDLTGMLSLNGALSLQPFALSAMYMMRILDPLNRFRVKW